MLKAIVFDFDGVIADSEPLHFRAFRDVIAPFGIRLSETAYYDRYLGFDDLKGFETMAADAGRPLTEGQLAALVADKARLMEALERDHPVLFPGAAHAVERAAAEYPLAIASGARRDEIIRTLARTDLSRFFKAIVSADDTSRSKPAPDPYVLAVDRLSIAVGARIDPRECAAIEDSQWGLQSARTAGLRTIGVTQTYDVTGLRGADLTIRSINDLDLRSLARLFSE
ncbi:MAG TPA: HAD family phosphatase [Vicinamibacterales bacterium]|nr:HAD family phosphatase [Vicinamibacterales bacterium]